MPERLTPTRVFSTPPLSGGAPAELKFAPAADLVTYVRAADDDRERMDLWKIDLHTGAHSLWLDARTLSDAGADVSELTAEERAERERRRQFNHGITQYSWHPDGRLMLPAEGQALLVDLSTTPPQATPVCPAATRQSGFQCSPLGGYLSYVRDGDLYIVDPESLAEQRITADATPTLKNGLPDFLAAEEMHRFQGHWWSPNDRYLAYTKVDEAAVRVSYRLEMQADGATTIEQRYPYAGERNPHVELWVHDLQTSVTTRIWTDIETSDLADGTAQDAYLARVHTANEKIVIQTQDRLQQHLRIKAYDLKQGTWSDLYAEASDTWINLTDDFRFLHDGRMLITSERNGTCEAYVLDEAGVLSVLPGPSHINAVLTVGENTAYVSGWSGSPIDNHLFAIDLAGKPTRQVTQSPGWHTVVVDEQGQRYIDQFSDERTPPVITLHDLAGAGPDVELYRSSITNEHPYAPYLPLHAYPVFHELRAGDGKMLYCRLTPPAEINGQHPTIVYVYGGPGPQKAHREWSPMLLQLFAHHGFAVLEVDNRGTGNRGRAFEAPIYRHMGGPEVEDQVTGLELLDQHAWADKSRVGIFGHSYGGYMTLMCLSQASRYFQAGVAVAPVCDWALYDTHYTERYMGLPTDNVKGYQQANVLTHLDGLKAPLLLMHGMADDNVLFTHSTKIMAHLQSLGTPFELMTYPGAKHSMQERDVSIHRFDMILDFFKRHLA